MKKSLLPLSVTLLAVGALTVLGSAVSAQSGHRTPDGRPDLQGTWSFATLTPLERPIEFGTKAVLTKEEARQYAEDSLKRRNMDTRAGGGAIDVERAYNDFWWDFGTTASLRTSLDHRPARRPHACVDARGAEADGRAVRRPARARPKAPRTACSPSAASSASTPARRFSPSAYNNNVQIVQTKDHVVLLNEMVHDARIVPLDGRPRAKTTRWMGESRGRWEGDTLVVETTNFKGPTSFAGSSEKMKLTERFKLDGRDTLLYQFTVEDPTTWVEAMDRARSRWRAALSRFTSTRATRGTTGWKGFSRAPAWTNSKPRNPPRAGRGKREGHRMATTTSRMDRRTLLKLMGRPARRRRSSRRRGSLDSDSR